MEQYHNLLKRILGEGEVQFEPRTQEYIIGIPGHQEIYDLREGFPLVTTKNVPPKLPFEELFWKLRGERNVMGLFDRNIHIWDGNAFDKYLKVTNQKETFPKHSAEWNEKFEWYREQLAKDPESVGNGDLGPVYGFQWRHWKDSNGKDIDQLKRVLDGIRNNPGSRYHTLSAWNVGDLSEMAIGPCPFWHQFTVYGDNLDLHAVQRSCDTYLGVPFNIAQDSLLTHLIAQETDLIPRRFIHTTINTHIYLGVPPRSNFWIDKENVNKFQERFNKIKDREEYTDLKNWYMESTQNEGAGDERKDHVPFVLEQLSKEPRALPNVTLNNIPLTEAIHLPVNDVVNVDGYNSHKWDAKANMAA